MDITVEVKEDHIRFFLELIKKFDFVKIKNLSSEFDAKSPYDQDFVAKIRRSEKQISEGNFKELAAGELWD